MLLQSMMFRDVYVTHIQYILSDIFIYFSFSYVWLLAFFPPTPFFWGAYVTVESCGEILHHERDDPLVLYLCRWQLLSKS